MPPALQRYLHTEIAATLAKKMAFIGGPRQVGKTTLALSLISPEATERHPAYLSWDDPKVRPSLRGGRLPPGEPIVILDEVHKYARWRNLVKGLYDTEKSVRRFIITGSARLDHYRRGGDSLAGRYRYYRLHPFSLTELAGCSSGSDGEHLEALLQFGGFPEPLLDRGERALRLWQRERMTRVVHEDLRDLEHVKEISLVEQLVDLLPDRVGSLLSVKSLREELEVDHKTVDRWITILERLYVCYRLPPLRKSADPRAQEAAEALSVGLVRRAGAGTALREPGRLPVAQVLPLAGRRRGRPDGAALPEGHGRKRSGLRGHAERRAGVCRGVQDRGADRELRRALLR